MNKIHLIAYASGIAGVDIHCGEGPLVLKTSAFLDSSLGKNTAAEWHLVQLPPNANQLPTEEVVERLCLELGKKVSECLTKKESFCVLGGDHTSAIGTWSGANHALRQKGDLGLIWFDAHMDSHTPETTESGRIHGMPLASLLGAGFPRLTNLFGAGPQIKPENVCLFGVRSYEKGEFDFLKRMQVRVYYAEEIKQRGFAAVFDEAISLVSKKTIGYGLSLDLDGIDPQDAPGVDVPEANGIRADEITAGLLKMITDPKFIGCEIVEFDPTRDINHQTEKLIISFLEIIAKGRPFLCKVSL